MKKILLLLTGFIFTYNSFAQKVDFINAPLNPVPDNSSVAQQNLKGDVFQSDFTNFTRDGKWFSYTNKISKVTLNASGMVIEEVNSLGSSHFYEYNTKGLRVKFTRGSHGESTLYTYDQNNRIIKEVYKHPSESWTIDYTYKQIKDVLIITVKQTGGSRPYEVEKHFKNGLEIQFQFKGKAPRKYHYEFDKKGNWIKRLTHDITSKTLIYEVNTRNIIYYDEYDQGINAMSIVAEKIIEELAVLSPTLRIYNKKYHTTSSRFNNDYVFYDGLSKTYYIAREAYINNKTIGQKSRIEKLSSGYETVILNDGKNFRIVENGEGAEKKYKFTTYFGHYVARDTLTGKVFGFSKIPANLTRTIAIAGNNIKDQSSSIWYIYDKKIDGLYILDYGKEVENLGIGGILNNGQDAVMTSNNSTRYVLMGLMNVKGDTIAKGRYFDPAKDKILTKNATSTANPQTSVKASTTALPSANNSSNSTSLSTDSKNYLSVYRNNPQGVKEHLAALYNVMLQKKYPPTMISGLFAIMAKEIFPINEDAAFDLLMKMPNGVVVRDVLSNLPKEMRDVIGKRARAKVATYAN